MSKPKFILLLLSLICFTVSCGDDDNISPNVNITSPQVNTIFGNTDTISLQGTATDDQELATITIETDFGLNEKDIILDSDTLHTMNYSIILDPITPLGDYTITVTATDFAGNTGSDQVQISIQ